MRASAWLAPAHRQCLCQRCLPQHTHCRISPFLGNTIGGPDGPFCSSLEHKRAPLSHFSNLLPETVVHRRPPVCDGAGMNSSADASNPSNDPSPLQDVIKHWLQFAAQQDLTEQIISHLSQARDAHPLTEAQQLVATLPGQPLPRSNRCTPTHRPLDPARVQASGGRLHCSAQQARRATHSAFT